MAPNAAFLEYINYYIKFMEVCGDRVVQPDNSIYTKYVTVRLPRRFGDSILFYYYNVNEAGVKTTIQYSFLLGTDFNYGRLDIGTFPNYPAFVTGDPCNLTLEILPSQDGLTQRFRQAYNARELVASYSPPSLLCQYTGTHPDTSAPISISYGLLGNSGNYVENSVSNYLEVYANAFP